MKTEALVSLTIFQFSGLFRFVLLLLPAILMFIFSSLSSSVDRVRPFFSCRTESRSTFVEVSKSPGTVQILSSLKEALIGG